MAELDRILTIEEPESRIELLGPFMGIAKDGRANMTGAQVEVFERARDALVSIPGHALFCQNRVESLRKEVVENARRSIPEIRQMEQEGHVVGLADYDSFRSRAFLILGQLPTPETVAVLGHFLNDPERRGRTDLLGNPITFSDSVAFGANCSAAAIAISSLRIENPPSRVVRPWGDNMASVYLTEDRAREVDAWKDWWNEVKAGKRTYRFIGSSMEYGPDGPAPAEALARIARADKRDAERADGKRRGAEAEDGQKEGRSGGILWVLPGVLLAGAAWYGLRKKAAA